MSDQLTPDGDPLAALAVLDPADLVVRPLAEISGRAARVRRARRVRTTALGAAASVALVASLALALPGGGTATSTPASESGTAPTAPVDCSHGTSVFDVGAHLGLVHLLDGADAPPLMSAYGLDLPGPPCSGAVGPAAVRARFSADGTSVTAAFVVSGPLAQARFAVDLLEPPPATPGVPPPGEPSPDPTDLPPGLVDEVVTVHGATAQLRRWTQKTRMLVAAGTGYVQWREPSTGKWWVVQAAGLSRADLLAVAEGLGTSGGRLDGDTVPTAGWTTLPALDMSRKGHRFDAGYDRVSLSVSDVPEFGPELVGMVTPGSVKVADVHGAQAFLKPVGLDGDSPELHWSDGRLWFSLYGPADMRFDELVALARSVAPVPSDDPRIVGAVATAPPNPYTEQPTPGGATSEPVPTAG
jgi:hypothetical protein